MVNSEAVAVAEDIINSQSFKDAAITDEAEAKRVLKESILFGQGLEMEVKQGNPDIIENEAIKGAIKKSRENIAQYIGQYNRLIDKAQNDIDKLDQQEARIRNHNQEVTYQTYDLQQERSKLGFFDGARKKEIDAELAKWQRQEIPPELEQERKKLQDTIKELKAHIASYEDKIKGITFYELEAERKLATERKQQKQTYTPQQKLQEAKKINERQSVREALREKQELIKASQEPREKPKEAPIIKGLKEVHKPNLKPLKRL